MLSQNDSHLLHADLELAGKLGGNTAVLDMAGNLIIGHAQQFPEDKLVMFTKAR
jgi:hypothetical protein